MLESSSPVYKEACDFLVAIAEPVCRTKFMQEYQLTPYSLYAGASMGLRTADILSAMERFSKTKVPAEVEAQVTSSTSRYGKVKLVLQHDRYYIECPGAAGCRCSCDAALLLPLTPFLAAEPPPAQHC
eukprot:1815387-Pleurochrysis_carterae.AAC.1